MADKGAGGGWVRALRGRLPRPSPRLTLLLLLAGASTIGASQNVMAPNLTSIARSFGLSDGDRDVVLGGWMNTAFFVVGAPASIFVGTLADRVNRKQLFLLLLAAGCIATAGTSVAWSVYQLLALRALLGAVYGSLNPLLFSFIGDLVPPASRPAAASAVSLAVGGGTAVGQLAAGALAKLGWRLPYIIITFLSAAAAGAIALAAVEPARGAAERDTSGSGSGSGSAGASAVASPAATDDDDDHAGATSGASSDSGSGMNGGDAATAPVSVALGTSTSGGAGERQLTTAELREQLGLAMSSLRHQLRRILAIRTNQLIYAQGLFGTIPWSVITVFLPDFLAQEVGFSVPHATFLVLLFGIGAAVGGVVGGTVLGNRLYARGPQYVSLTFGVIQMASALPMLWIINLPRVDDSGVDGISDGEPGRPPLTLIYAVAAVAGLVASMTGPNLKALMMNVNLPHTRGAVFTFANIADSVSKGLAPYILGLLISLGGMARATVFTAALLGWVASGALIALSASYVAADEAEARSKGAAAAAAAAGVGATGSGGGVATRTTAAAVHAGAGARVRSHVPD